LRSSCSSRTVEDTTTTTEKETTIMATYDHKYGDTITTVEIPLLNTYSYTKGQQELVDFAIDHGWALDITAISNTYGYRFDNLPVERRVANLKQHPFKFVRPATDALGGTWQLTLDYVSREYSHYGNRGFSKNLKGAKLVRVFADGTKSVYPSGLSGYATSTSSRDNVEIVLQPTSKAGYASNNWVWDAAQVGEGYTLRERVQVLLTAPESVVAHAVELMAASEAREIARRAEKQRVAELKARPLPAGWDALQVIAVSIAKADGLSDTDALLAALKAAVAVVEEEVVVH
jgi:hypothetical protein